jgi:type II secretory pathway component HofQ
MKSGLQLVLPGLFVFVAVWHVDATGQEEFRTQNTSVNARSTPEQPSTRDAPKRWQEKHKRLLAELDKTTEFEFLEAALYEALDTLAKQHDFQYVLDRAALDALGIDEHIQVTLALRDVSLRSGLQNLLRPLELDFTVDHEVIRVTSPAEVEQTVTVRVYEVLDLLHPKQLEESMHRLSNVVMQTIAPDTWELFGGPGQLCSYQGLLVVNNTDDIHGDIKQLLQQMRTSLEKMGGPQIVSRKCAAAGRVEARSRRAGRDGRPASGASRPD